MILTDVQKNLPTRPLSKYITKPIPAHQYLKHMTQKKLHSHKILPDLFKNYYPNDLCPKKIIHMIHKKY